jgi:xanthine dehydrogenase/oxidase
MACFAAPNSVQSVLCELAGESNPLIARRVIDAPSPVQLSKLLSIAEARLGCSLLPLVEFIDKQGISRTLETDDSLVEVLDLGGCFRFHRSETIPLVATATIPAPTAAATSNSLQLVVNGKQILVRDPHPSMLLVDFLRDNLKLTGTKIGCGEGGCGACTVMVKESSADDSTAVPINSCLRLLCSCDALEITTVEGLGSESSGFSEIQSAIADGNGSQCGFCTPGWVVNMSALMTANPTPSPAEVEQHFDGNICRCTGYRPILEAFQEVAGKARQIECRLDLNHCGDMEDIAGEESKCCSSKKGKAVKKGGCCKSKKFDPPAVQSLHYSDPLTRDEYWRPSTLTQLLQLINEFETSPSPAPKNVQIVSGNTGMAVGKYYDPEAWNYGQPKEGDNVLIDVKGVPDLTAISTGDDGVSIGAAVTIAQLISTLEDTFSSDHAVYGGVIRHLKRVANTQVRSAGSWAGNLCLLASNPTFNSDVSIIMATLGVTLVIADTATGETSSIAVEDWLSQGGGGVIVSGLFPLCSPQDGSTYLWYSDKTGQRHVNSHAITNAGFLLTINSSDSTITSVRVTVGGLLEGFARLTSVEAAILGGDMSEDTLQAGLTALDAAVKAAGGPSYDAQNSDKYRLGLARSFLYKMFLTYASNTGTLSPDLTSACAPFAAAEDRPVSRGHQLYHVDDPSTAPVGEYITKLSARIQASGEAKYASDLGSKGCLYASFILSECSLSKLESIDSSEALTCPGVTAIITAADVPGNNRFHDNRQTLFVDIGQTSQYVGAPVGVVVADTLKRARAAAKKVKLKWSELRPSEIERPADIDGDGPEWDAFVKSPLGRRMKVRREGGNGKQILGATVKNGDVDAAFCRAQDNGLQIAGGRLYMSGQKHFFLETHTTLAVPDEDRRMLVTCATQFGQYTQMMLASMLGLPAHRIEVKTRRIGGAYGGKITQNVFTAGAACVAALVVGQPVLMHNERVDDMTMYGGREAMEVSYHVGYTDGSVGDAGHIQALDMFFAVDGTYDGTDALGSLVMATQWSDSCYYVPDFRSKGTVRYSARAGCASCRAPGNLQSISFREMINEHVAKKLGVPHIVIQERNMYMDGQTTPFGDVIGSSGFNWTIPELWRRTKEAVHYDARVAAVHEFNAVNRFHKRGVCMVPTKYGFSPPEYKVGCLVNIFAADGTVVVHHSGSELGQGINTKVAQAVAMGLGIPLSSVIIGDNSTAVVPNAGCTGGSGTSEACVGAAIIACQELMNRLEPYIESSDSWADAVATASGDGIGLTYNGWFNMQPPDSAVFEYATQGVGFAEVEIDCLTGEVQILRCDLHMDLGYSLNPAIDIGQVEGGFVMALGYMLTEEVIFSAPKRGGVALDEHAANQVQVNLGTWLYKPPSALDIPQVLNINLMPNTPNPSANAVLSSKGCGEPPMALACAVTLAVKEAIYASRKALHGIDDHIQLDLPLSVERIQAACLCQGSLHL